MNTSIRSPASSSRAAPAAPPPSDSPTVGHKNPGASSKNDDRAIGKQLESDRPTSACYSFGKSATREKRKLCGDILIGSGSDFLGRTSPGVTYDLNLSLVSRWKGTTFGKAARPTSGTVAYPPSTNDLKCVIPKFDKYRNKQDGRVVFGRETREAGAKNGANAVKGTGNSEFYARESPGCIYDPKDKLVKEIVTRSWTMGMRTKIIGMKDPKNVVDPESNLKPETAMGKQLNSRKPSAMGRSFSKASRFGKNASEKDREREKLFAVQKAAAARPATAPSGGGGGTTEVNTAEGDAGTAGAATKGATIVPPAAAQPQHTKHAATTGQQVVLTKIQRGLGKQIDLKSAPVFGISRKKHQSPSTLSCKTCIKSGVCHAKNEWGWVFLPGYGISKCSRDKRSVSGNMIIKEDRPAALSNMQHQRLPHNFNYPAPSAVRKWGS
ncbi:unnamed protein product [Amoebophrya sp. A120]|nr:unnamed protein product [Amoebophrya sp. A120]|eukprot:GSA120T00006751001.1